MPVATIPDKVSRRAVHAVVKDFCQSGSRGPTHIAEYADVVPEGLFHTEPEMALRLGIWNRKRRISFPGSG